MRALKNSSYSKEGAAFCEPLLRISTPTPPAPPPFPDDTPEPMKAGWGPNLSGEEMTGKLKKMFSTSIEIQEIRVIPIISTIKLPPKGLNQGRIMVRIL